MTAARSIPKRSETIRAHKGHGGLVAAVLPIHYPRALLRAFNILPVEVWGPPGLDAATAAAHLQPYVCSIVRNALAFLQAGGLEVVDLILVPHGCDSLQGLASILIDFVQPRQPVIPLCIPRGTSGNEIEDLAEGFRSVYCRLEQILGRARTRIETGTRSRSRSQAVRDGIAAGTIERIGEVRARGVADRENQVPSV